MKLSERTGSFSAGKSWRFPVTVFLGVIAVVIGILLLARPQQETTVGGGSLQSTAAAERLALPSTAGANLQLAQLRGSRVVLYFFEGSG